MACVPGDKSRHAGKRGLQVHLIVGVLKAKCGIGWSNDGGHPLEFRD